MGKSHNEGHQTKRPFIAFYQYNEVKYNERRKE